MVTLTRDQAQVLLDYIGEVRTYTDDPGWNSESLAALEAALGALRASLGSEEGE